VWIDYNNDGDFLDVGEKIYSIATADRTTRTASITVPATASVGSTRMRVGTSPNMPAAYNGCGAIGSVGEVEDYTVTIAVDSVVAVCGNHVVE